MPLVLVVLLGFWWVGGPQLAASQPWDDPTPRVLVYGAFESDTTPLTIGGPWTLTRVVREAGKFGAGLTIQKGTFGLGSVITAGAHQFDPVRGTVSLWLKITTWDSTTTHAQELLSIYPGLPSLTLNYAGNAAPLTLDLTVDGQRLKTVGTLTVGTWHHLAWVYWGATHTLYLDGVAQTVTLLSAGGSFTVPPPLVLGSPMVSEQLAAFRIGTFGGGNQDCVIDELTTYNVPLTPAEVQTLATASTPGPLSSFGIYGPQVTVQWAPGEQQAHVAMDPGNTYAASATEATVAIIQSVPLSTATSQMTGPRLTLTPGGTLSLKAEPRQTLATASIAQLRRGLGQVILDLPSTTPGTYAAEVTVLSAAKAPLAATTSRPWTLPPTPWLHNTLGVSDAVQPPWTAITRAGQTLGVIGRSIDLGGYGLPQQLTSQGKTLLSSPIVLEFTQGGSLTSVTAQSMTIDTVANHEVTWHGSATVGTSTLTLTGKLEYDGMLLYTVTLSPPVGGSAAFDTINLQMRMPAARALFMHTSTDQTYWWYTYKANVPTAVGSFHTNLLQTPNLSKFLPAVVFSDHEVGLEWFADHPSGWRLNEAQASQEMVVEAGSIVRLENKIANKAFTLTAPLTWTFGFLATPTKPLPTNWRTAYVHFNSSVPLTTDLKFWWVFPGECAVQRGGSFNLYPVDIPGYKSCLQTKRTTHQLRVAPFVNAHVLLPHGPDTWPSLQAILQDEWHNDQWVAIQTKGSRDYWAYNHWQWIAADALDAIYIDEAFTFTPQAYLLSGGYVKEDGTHGVGYSHLHVRQLLKRLRQLLLDQGKAPVLWLHTTGNMLPHAWSFADIISDGEAYEFTNPANPDWVEVWAEHLLDGTVGPGSVGGPWLLAIGRAQKYGFLPVFLNYIRFTSDGTNYPKFARQMQGVLSLLDMLPIDYFTTAYSSPIPALKQAFDIGSPGVTFVGYWAQANLVASSGTVPISYWHKSGEVLATVQNLGEAFSGTVAVNAAGLGLTNPLVQNAETGATLPLTAGSFPLTVGRHDYQMIRLQSQ